MSAVFVAGKGLWAPGFRDAAAWLQGQPDAAVAAPAAELLPAASRRRASALTRMVAEAAGAAAAESGTDLGQAPIVLGSRFGEIGAAVEMIASFREGEGLPSPTRFHNSVHNGPAAYVSMATGNRGLATAVAAGDDTAGMALLEAIGILDERGGDVLLLLGDEALPPPLAGCRSYTPGAVALVLSSAPRRSGCVRLQGLRRGTAPAVELPRGFAEHPCAGGFALVAAASRGAGTVALGAAREGWIVDLYPAGAA